MDIPGRSIDATLNIQAKETGLSETSDALNEVRDALSEVAAVSEAAEEQLDDVNDELSRSETEASSASASFTALAGSMAAASQAAESLDDNLDDIDGVSASAFLPDVDDIDDRVTEIEDRINDIDLDSVGADTSVDRGDGPVTDGGEDFSEFIDAIEQRLEEQNKALDDADIADQVETRDEKLEFLDELIGPRHDDPDVTTDRDNLLSQLEKVEEVQEQRQEHLEDRHRILSQSSDANEETIDAIEEDLIELEHQQSRINKIRRRLNDMPLLFGLSGTQIETDDDIGDIEKEDVDVKELHEFTERQKELADLFDDAADAAEERMKGQSRIRKAFDEDLLTRNEHGNTVIRTAADEDMHRGQRKELVQAFDALRKRDDNDISELDLTNINEEQSTTLIQELKEDVVSSVQLRKNSDEPNRDARTVGSFVLPLHLNPKPLEETISGSKTIDEAYSEEGVGEILDEQSEARRSFRELSFNLPSMEEVEDMRDDESVARRAEQLKEALEHNFAIQRFHQKKTAQIRKRLGHSIRAARNELVSAGIPAFEQQEEEGFILDRNDTTLTQALPETTDIQRLIDDQYDMSDEERSNLDVMETNQVSATAPGEFTGVTNPADTVDYDVETKDKYKVDSDTATVVDDDAVDKTQSDRDAEEIIALEEDEIEEVREEFPDKDESTIKNLARRAKQAKQGIRDDVDSFDPKGDDNILGGGTSMSSLADADLAEIAAEIDSRRSDTDGEATVTEAFEKVLLEGSRFPSDESDADGSDDTASALRETVTFLEELLIDENRDPIPSRRVEEGKLNLNNEEIIEGMEVLSPFFSQAPRSTRMSVDNEGDILEPTNFRFARQIRSEIDLVNELEEQLVEFFDAFIDDDEGIIDPELLSRQTTLDSLIRSSGSERTDRLAFTPFDDGVDEISSFPTPGTIEMAPAYKKGGVSMGAEDLTQARLTDLMTSESGKAILDRLAIADRDETVEDFFKPDPEAVDNREIFGPELPPEDQQRLSEIGIKQADDVSPGESDNLLLSDLVNKIGSKRQERLSSAGIGTMSDARKASASELTDVKGIGETLSERIKQEVSEDNRTPFDEVDFINARDFKTTVNETKETDLLTDTKDSISDSDITNTGKFIREKGSDENLIETDDELADSVNHRIQEKLKLIANQFDTGRSSVSEFTATDLLLDTEVREVLDRVGGHDASKVDPTELDPITGTDTGGLTDSKTETDAEDPFGIFSGGGDSGGDSGGGSGRGSGGDEGDGGDGGGGDDGDDRDFPPQTTVTQNPFLRLGEESNVFAPSVADFDERVDESNVERPRSIQVAEEFAQLARIRKLTRESDVTRSEINELIDRTGSSDAATDASALVQRNKEELFRSGVAEEVFARAMRSGGLSPENIKDILRQGEFVIPEASFEQTMDKLEDFEDTIIDVDDGLAALIPNSEREDVNLRGLSTELERVNTEIEKSSKADSKSGFFPDDITNLRELIDQFDDIRQFVESENGTQTFKSLRDDEFDVENALADFVDELDDIVDTITRDSKDVDVLDALEGTPDVQADQKEDQEVVEERSKKAVEEIENARNRIVERSGDIEGVGPQKARRFSEEVLSEMDRFTVERIRDNAENVQTKRMADPDLMAVISEELSNVKHILAKRDQFELDDKNELKSRALIDEIIGVGDSVNLGQDQLESRREDAVENQVSREMMNDPNRQQAGLIDLLVSGAEDEDIRSVIEHTFDQRFSAMDVESRQNILAELRETAETTSEGADVARLRQFVEMFDDEFFDQAAQMLDNDDVTGTRPGSIGERSRAIESAFNLDVDEVGTRRVLARATKSLQESGISVGNETLRARLSQMFFETDSSELQDIISEIIEDVKAGDIDTSSILLDDRAFDTFDEQVRRNVEDSSVVNDMGQTVADKISRDIRDGFKENDELKNIQQLFDDNVPINVRDVLRFGDGDLEDTEMSFEEIAEAAEMALKEAKRLEQLETAPDVDQLTLDQATEPARLQREAEKARMEFGDEQALDVGTGFTRVLKRSILQDGADEDSGFVVNSLSRITTAAGVADDAAINLSKTLGGFGSVLGELKPELGITSASLGAFNISLRNAGAVTIGLTTVLGPLVSLVGGLAGGFGALAGAVGLFTATGALGFLDDMANRMANVENRTEAAEQLFKALRDEAITRLDPLRDVTLSLGGDEVGGQELFASGILEALDVLEQLAAISANILEIDEVQQSIDRIITAFTTSDGELSLNEALMEFSKEVMPTVADMTVFLINNLPEFISFLGDITKILDQPVGKLFIQAVDLAATLTKIGAGAVFVYAELASLFLRMLNLLGGIVDLAAELSDVLGAEQFEVFGGTNNAKDGDMSDDDDKGLFGFSAAAGLGGAIALPFALDALASVVKRFGNTIRRMGLFIRVFAKALSFIPRLGGVVSSIGNAVPKKLIPTAKEGGTVAKFLNAGADTADEVAGNQATLNQFADDSPGVLRRAGGALKGFIGPQGPIQDGRIANGIRGIRDSGGLGSRITSAGRSAISGTGGALRKAGLLEDLSDDIVRVGLSNRRGLSRTIEGNLGSILSNIDNRVVTDGGVVTDEAARAGRGGLQSIMGRIPQKIDSVIQSIKTVDTSINSLDEILKAGKSGLARGGSMLGKIGLRGILTSGGALAAIGGLLTRGKGSAIGKVLKGGKTGKILGGLASMTGIPGLRTGEIGSISKFLNSKIGAVAKLLPSKLVTPLKAGLSGLFKALGNAGLKKITEKLGLGLITKLLGGRLVALIPVVGQLITLFDFLVMGITALLPGVEMMSPIGMALEGLFNVMMDFIDFMKNLTLEKVLNALASSVNDGGGDGERGVMPGPGGPSKVQQGQNGPQANTPNQNQSIAAGQPSTQTGPGGPSASRQNVNVTVNGNADEETLAQRIMDRIQMKERKDNQFYNGSNAAPSRGPSPGGN